LEQAREIQQGKETKQAHQRMNATISRDPYMESRPCMNSFRHPIRFSVILTATAIVASSLLAGCVGVRTDVEKRARQDQESVGQVYRPGGERPRPCAHWHDGEHHHPQAEM
jgi:hypothetical protein